MKNVIKKDRVVSCVLTLSLLICLAGCGSSNKKTANPDNYIQIAKSYIDVGDLDSALKILQDGFSDTGDSAVAELLAQTIELQTQTEKQTEENVSDEAAEQPEKEQVGQEKVAAIDIADYMGEWAEKTYGYEHGGLALWFSYAAGGKVSVNLEQTQAYPACRVASVSEKFSQEELCADKTFTFAATDSWGIQGLFKLTFEKDRIVCDISNTKNVQNSIVPWSVVEGRYTLYPTKLSEVYDDSITPSSAFYDLIGFYADVYGANIFMTIEYDENDTAWAEIALPIDTVRIPLTEADPNDVTVFGGVDYNPALASEPISAIGIEIDSGIYYVEIYISEYDYYEIIPFVPANPADYGL